MMNYIKLLFSNNSILRILQKNEFRKYKLSGKCLEFGANHKIQRNFLYKDSKKSKLIDISVRLNQIQKYLTL